MDDRTGRFSRDARLTHPAQYRWVFDSPERSSDRWFTVLARRSNGLQQARLGLAISKKAIRTAVGRNRVKRLIRESFRQRRASLENLDIVVLARSGVAAQSSHAITASLARHWNRIGR